jgi:ketosteroid isomerase-like protein
MIFNVIALVVSAVTPPEAPVVNPLETTVQCHEVAFSRSVEQQDVEKFRSFLDADVRFASGPSLRGPDAVVAGWISFFQPEGTRIRWWPDKIEVRESGELALSQGPYEMTIKNEAGTTYLTGRFISVWQADDEGNWKIIFDTGTAATQVSGPLESPWSDAAYAEKCGGGNS